MLEVVQGIPRFSRKKEIALPALDLSAPFSLLLEAQPPGINHPADRKSGQAIDQNIREPNKHSPMG